ncbi:uncharacterized protein LOC135823128 [Sycon ciliatum]|uniref:uncharacterized protein LOC135823128 n=1 Tax=Sycon ciliatum TaxID=27933 RepID=UPI0020AD4D8B|eukprot:scpid57673/ scgid10184/ 
MVFSVPYMTVTHRDENSMKMVRSPPFRAWLVFFGIMAGGAYCAYESRDWTYGSFYFLCGVMLAHVAMDRWEEAQLDKAKNKVIIFHRTLLDVVLRRQPDRCVVSNLSEVVDVRVESESLKYAGTTYNVVLAFETGYTLGLTSSGTYGDKFIHEKLAGELRDFLSMKSSAQFLENIDTAIDTAIAAHVARAGPPPTSASSASSTDGGSREPQERRRQTARGSPTQE